MERRAVLVSSPHAGNAISVARLAACLENVGVTVARNLLVSDLDHTQPQGTIWRERGYDLVIAAGGDGTIGSVATQLAGSGMPLAILPMGTANDVARSLQLPMDIEAACGVIAGATPIDIDIGQALPALTEPGAYMAEREEIPLAGEPSPLAGVYFTHAMTLGLNVEFARLATDSLRRQRLGNLTYAASALEAVARYHPVDVMLRVFGMEGEDDTSETVIQTRAVQVCVVNAPVFGGRISVRLPDVRLRDQRLDFMIIEALDARQLRHTVQRLIAAISATPDQPDRVSADEQENEGLRLPGVRWFRARAAIIAAADAADTADVTLDGEIRTHTPVLVRVSPHRLRVLVAPQTKRLLMRDS